MFFTLKGLQFGDELSTKAGLIRKIIDIPIYLSNNMKKVYCFLDCNILLLNELLKLHLLDAVQLLKNIRY